MDHPLSNKVLVTRKTKMHSKSSYAPFNKPMR